MFGGYLILHPQIIGILNNNICFNLNNLKQIKVCIINYNYQLRDELIAKVNYCMLFILFIFF